MNAREKVYMISDRGVSTAMSQAFDLFQTKNRKYDNTIVKTGVLGAVIEIIGAAGRLPVMVLRSVGHGRNDRDKLIDVLRDILNYAAIALFMIESDNWEGEG